MASGLASGVTDEALQWVSAMSSLMREADAQRLQALNRDVAAIDASLQPLMAAVEAAAAAAAAAGGAQGQGWALPARVKEQRVALHAAARMKRVDAEVAIADLRHRAGMRRLYHGSSATKAAQQAMEDLGELTALEARWTELMLTLDGQLYGGTGGRYTPRTPRAGDLPAPHGIAATGAIESATAAVAGAATATEAEDGSGEGLGAGHAAEGAAGGDGSGGDARLAGTEVPASNDAPSAAAAPVQGDAQSTGAALESAGAEGQAAVPMEGSAEPGPPVHASEEEPNAERGSGVNRTEAEGPAVQEVGQDVAAAGEGDMQAPGVVGVAGAAADPEALSGLDATAASAEVATDDHTNAPKGTSAGRHDGSGSGNPDPAGDISLAAAADDGADGGDTDIGSSNPPPTAASDAGAGTAADGS